MSAIFNNLGNPLRFYNKSDIPNYTTLFPTAYNIKPGVNYIPGVYPANYYRDWILNQDVKLQFQVVDSIEETLTVFKFNTVTKIYDVFANITPVEITPVGWLSSKVNSYTWKPTTGGLYYIEFTGANFISDKFYVHTEQKYLKRLVKIDYWNYENDYGMVFYDGLENIWSGTTFYSGTNIGEKLKNTYSTYKSDRGGLRKVKSTPIQNSTLTLTETHLSQQPFINTLFSFSEIYVNGIAYSNEESPDFERKNNSDIGDFKIEMQEKYSNYFTH
jgi:hypothetical protein